MAKTPPPAMARNQKKVWVRPDGPKLLYRANKNYGKQKFWETPQIFPNFFSRNFCQAWVSDAPCFNWDTGKQRTKEHVTTCYADCLSVVGTLTHSGRRSTHCKHKLQQGHLHRVASFAFAEKTVSTQLSQATCVHCFKHEMMNWSAG